MRTVAAFDFDGTISQGDAVIPFMVALRGPVRTALALASLIPLLPTRNRDVLKRAMSRRLLRGISEENLFVTGQNFAEHLISNKLMPDMVERLRWHELQGHQIIVVSASYDAYLREVAKRLNIETLICTRVEIVDGVCTGNLVEDINVRSHKKTELLLKALGDLGDVELYAYGNSSGDVPMLAVADHPYWVDRNGQFSDWKS